jgi:hypothetical protein
VLPKSNDPNSHAFTLCLPACTAAAKKRWTSLVR